ncbi:hypothetical protein WJS89_10590 [Sphingomicrobium sp. XHP0235]|uniref:hypothetical protein n=1 Tax=Sphingomicrobium aquimarinum TaxID=3133971 RepID=UPI0031FE9FA3
MIDARIPLGIQQPDMMGQFERVQRMKLSDMMAQQRQEELAYKREQDAKAAEANARKQQFENMATIAKLTQGVTAENYAQRMRTAQQMGLDVSGLPQTFDPAVIGELNAVATALSKAGPEKMSAEAQKLIDAGKQPGTPEFEEAMMALIFKPQYVADQGYGVNVYNTRPGAAPAPQQSAPPPPPPGFSIDGEGTAGNGGGGFPQPF